MSNGREKRRWEEEENNTKKNPQKNKTKEPNAESWKIFNLNILKCVHVFKNMKAGIAFSFEAVCRLPRHYTCLILFLTHSSEYAAEKDSWMFTSKSISFSISFFFLWNTSSRNIFFLGHLTPLLMKKVPSGKQRTNSAMQISRRALCFNSWRWQTWFVHKTAKSCPWPWRKQSALPSHTSSFLPFTKHKT